MNLLIIPVFLLPFCMGESKCTEEEDKRQSNHSSSVHSEIRDIKSGDEKPTIENPHELNVEKKKCNHSILRCRIVNSFAVMGIGFACCSLYCNYVLFLHPDDMACEINGDRAYNLAKFAFILYFASLM